MTTTHEWALMSFNHPRNHLHAAVWIMFITLEEFLFSVSCLKEKKAATTVFFWATNCEWREIKGQSINHSFIKLITTEGP